MTFTRRYLAWLLIPPVLISVPAALLFLSQVLQLSTREVTWLSVMVAANYLIGCAMFVRGVRPHADAVQEALEHGGDLSGPMSRTLDRTTSLSVLLWVGGGALFAVIATLVFLPTLLGFAYFLVASLIAAFASVVWGYAMGKHRLSEAAAGKRVRYTGRGLTLGAKIGVVFIGFLTISAAALVLLISTRVSATLEALAIRSAASSFEWALDSAQRERQLDLEALNSIRGDFPPQYALHLIPPQGNPISTGDALTPREVEAIRERGTGDSTAFSAPHVSRFAKLANGSIVVLTVPWGPYQHIPRQITFYTIVVSLLTTLIFGAATVVLSRDITGPLRQLREVSREMAQGNFDAAPRVFADDEVGSLAESFGETRSNLRGLLARIGGSGTTITDGVRVITGGTETLLARSREQSELTEGSTVAVENVRGGIGEVLIAAETVTELTQDASSRALELQASAEEIAQSMDFLFQSVEKTSSSTTELHASMNEMTQRTETLSGIGEEVLSFVSEMESTSVELLSTSQSTAELAQKVREDALAGGAAVDRTVEGINATQDLTTSTARTMDELQRSVGEISQILTVIEDVANRTNLLSLNAAIIAAQAGEHGAGFSVVAGEIRELAERTRGSTMEIGTIIRAVQSGSRQAVQKMHEGVARVSENVRVAEEAAASLDKIVGSATRSFEMATRISRALEEQSRASRRLHEVTMRMSDQIAEMNRASREQTRGTQLMAEESERVRDIAGQVKNATEEQSLAGKGISIALEKIADDARAMRDLLESQLRETDRIADASRVMLDIAQKNDAVAREFTSAVQNLVRSGKEFESEVTRFRFKGES
jgi:methyl-accepting chemotaxis protein